MTTAKKPRIGLALGSGAARGMAHIGVLRALEEAELQPDILVGTSIGALVGGIYAAGKLDDFTEIALELNWGDMARYFAEVSFPRSGLIEGTKVAHFLKEIVGTCALEDLPILYQCVATNIMTGDEVVLRKGDLVAAIRASIAVPGVFAPARRGNEFLADGGMVNPVPVSVCRALGAEKIIAVDLNYGRIQENLPEKKGEEKRSPRGKRAGEFFAWLENNTPQLDTSFLNPLKTWAEREPMPNIFDVLGNSIRIMEEQIALNRLKIDVPDLLIRPAVGSVRFMEFFRARDMIEEGYRATKEALKNNGKEILQGA